MTRDDSLLYTGASSASFTTPKSEEIKDKRDLKKQERKDAQHKLKPSAEVVLGLIERHKDKVKSIEEFAVEDMVSDEHFKSEVMARKKFYQFLMQFEQEIKIALKESHE